MQLEVIANTPSHLGISLSLTPGEIGRLAKQLSALQSFPDQHFHLSNLDDERFFDIEFSVDTTDGPDSGAVSGFAIEPDVGT